MSNNIGVLKRVAGIQVNFHVLRIFFEFPFVFPCKRKFEKNAKSFRKYAEIHLNSHYRDNPPFVPSCQRKNKYGDM